MSSKNLWWDLLFINTKTLQLREILPKCDGGVTRDDQENDNSSGRSAIYRLPTRKLLAVDRIFIHDFVSLISVVTGNGNPLHFWSIFPVGKPTASYLLTPTQTCFALVSRLHRQWSLLRGYRPLMRPTPLPRKISYIYHTMLNFIWCRFVMHTLLLLLGLGLGLKCGSLV